MVVYWDLAPLLSNQTAMNMTKDKMETVINNVMAKVMRMEMCHQVME